MSKLLVIFGITGQQGGSVANHVLNSKDLREEYHIRGVTRDIDSPKARSFQDRGVQLCQADWADPSSLAKAVQGAHTVFIVTLPAGFHDGELRESVHGKTCVDAAVDAGVQAIVFSTLPNLIRISNGKYHGVHNFNAKVEVETYIRQRPVRSAFVAPGRFMQNYLLRMTPKQSKAGEGPYLIREMFAPQDRLPLVDIVSDTGRYVGAILRDFDRFEGKTLALAENLYSMEEIAAALSKSSGLPVEYEQFSETEMRAQFPPPQAEVFVQAHRCQSEFGFYGPHSAKMIASAKELTKETLTSFDEFLKVHKWN